MVKHIVLFQLAPEMEAERKKNVMDAFKEGIEALPAKIPFIRKIEVGLMPIRKNNSTSRSTASSTRWTT